ncbi:MAG: CopD family protein [Acidihalobacter sp.]
MPYLLSLHLLAALIWVGGMFFAYLALRPAAASALEAPQRLRLWEAVFARFFPWVWLCVLALLASGLWMTYGWYGGMRAPSYVHAMFGLGLLMMALFAHLYFAPYRRMRQALADGDFAQGGRRLGQIRMIVGINLLLGLVVTVIAAAGPLLS